MANFIFNSCTSTETIVSSSTADVIKHDGECYSNTKVESSEMPVETVEEFVSCVKCLGAKRMIQLKENSMTTGVVVVAYSTNGFELEEGNIYEDLDTGIWYECAGESSQKYNPISIDFELKAGADRSWYMGCKRMSLCRNEGFEEESIITIKTDKELMSGYTYEVLNDNSSDDAIYLFQETCNCDKFSIESEIISKFCKSCNVSYRAYTIVSCSLPKKVKKIYWKAYGSFARTDFDFANGIEKALFEQPDINKIYVFDFDEETCYHITEEEGFECEEILDQEREVYTVKNVITSFVDCEKCNELIYLFIPCGSETVYKVLNTDIRQFVNGFVKIQIANEEDVRCGFLFSAKAYLYTDVETINIQGFEEHCYGTCEECNRKERYNIALPKSRIMPYQYVAKCNHKWKCCE